MKQAGGLLLPLIWEDLHRELLLTPFMRKPEVRLFQDGSRALLLANPDD